MDRVLYKISIGDYFYFGQTKNIKKRRWRHEWLLKNKRHFNPKMQNVYNKYQEYSFEVVEYSDESNIDALEQQYIDSNWGNKKFMNAARRVESPMKGRTMSPEQRKKLSERLRLEGHPNAKLVLDTATGIFYDSLKEASVTLEINYSTLRSMLQGLNPNKTNLMYV